MIEVTVSGLDVVRDAPPNVSLDYWLRLTAMRRLAEAGAPIRGHILPNIERGVLTRCDDATSDHIKFRWSES